MHDLRWPSLPIAARVVILTYDQRSKYPYGSLLSTSSLPVTSQHRP